MDTVLIGIRIATYGESLDMTYKCDSCKEEQARSFNLLTAIEYFNTISYNSTVVIEPYSGKLAKFYRQPKVFIALPSGGTHYYKGMIDGDPTNLPVFGMNAMDELMYKNPDALFSGEATVSVIQSCCLLYTSDAADE